VSDGGGFAPIFLLADSRPLFAAQGRPSVLARALPHLPDSPRAAYLGASNGDDPTFYELFAAAMDEVGIENRQMVNSRFSSADREWLEGADLVVLAGGDVERGWRLFEQRGVDEVLLARFQAGAVLVGVSAGAVQLGWGWLGLVPAWIGAHEEKEGWGELRGRVQGSGSDESQGSDKSRDRQVRGLGVPFGGTLVVHGNGEFEALRRGVVELAFTEDGQIRESVLLPADPEEAGAG